MIEVQLSKSRLLQNVKIFSDVASGRYVFPVVKSNAYGHGLAEVATVLKDYKTPYLCVQTPQEARLVRRTTNQPSLILGPLFAKTDFAELADCAFTVSSFAHIDLLEQAKQSITIHIKQNTGMNRQGFELHELADVLKKIKKLEHVDLEGFCSHLSSADDIDPGETKRQEKLVAEGLKIIDELKIYPKYIHLGNSAGATKITDPRINVIRPGIGIYGCNPLLADDPHFTKLSRLQPVLKLTTKISHVHTLQPGEKVSYNGTFIAKKRTTIGVVPIGYYEALDRKLSNRGTFRLPDHDFENCQIAGRVCMNLTCFVAPKHCNIGDTVEIISSDVSAPNSAINIAKTTKTIPYEVFTRIMPHLPRTIVG
jgi:alanine racemase